MVLTLHAGTHGPVQLHRPRGITSFTDEAHAALRDSIAQTLNSISLPRHRITALDLHRGPLTQPGLACNKPLEYLVELYCFLFSTRLSLTCGVTWLLSVHLLLPSLLLMLELRLKSCSSWSHALAVLLLRGI
jgi:hypothetical protein